MTEKSVSTPPKPRPVACPNAYCWLILVSALDIIFTRIVLQFGGAEVNPIAQRAIDAAGHWGLIGLKFAAVTLVITICEHIAATRPAVTRRLAYGAIALSAMPVLLAIGQLLTHIGVVVVD